MSKDVKNPQRREALSQGAKIIAGAAVGGAALATGAHAKDDSGKYDDPKQYALPQVGMKFDK